MKISRKIYLYISKNLNHEKNNFTITNLLYIIC